jgi:hypothetical protein
MPKLLIASEASDAADETIDIVVITGDYAPTPVKAMFRARDLLQSPWYWSPARQS